MQTRTMSGTEAVAEMVAGGFQAVRVYRGAARKCCCGCSGKYGETQRSITTALNILKQQDKVDVTDGLSDELILSADIGNRCVVAYLRKGA